MSLFCIFTGCLYLLDPVFSSSPYGYQFTTSPSSLAYGMFVNCTFIHTISFNVWKKTWHIQCERDSPTLSSPLHLNTNSASLVSQLAGIFGATQALGASSAVTHFTPPQILGFWQRVRKKAAISKQIHKSKYIYMRVSDSALQLHQSFHGASIICLSLAV